MNELPDKIRIRNEAAKSLNSNILYRKYIHKLCTLNENSNHSNSKLRILAFGPVRRPSSRKSKHACMSQFDSLSVTRENWASFWSSIPKNALHFKPPESSSCDMLRSFLHSQRVSIREAQRVDSPTQPYLGVKRLFLSFSVVLVFCQ